MAAFLRYVRKPYGTLQILNYYSLKLLDRDTGTVMLSSCLNYQEGAVVEEPDQLSVLKV
jgi:hypothetical protein